jgi:hypothetical protein
MPAPQSKLKRVVFHWSEPVHDIGVDLDHNLSAVCFDAAWI